MSTQLMKLNYLVILPATQHHSFFRNLPPDRFRLFYSSVNSFVFVSIEKIYQTLETVSSAIQTPRRELQRAAEYFWRNSIEEFRKPMKHCLQYLIYHFNRNKNERVNGRVKSSKSMLIKTGYPNFLHSCDFLCFNVMN